MVTLREQHRSRAAYTLVDLNSIEDEELRKDIALDASEGGGIYGIRVVEESVNGAARFPIYGVYNEGPDAERWTGAKDKLGLAGEEADDASVYQGAGVEVTDVRKEAALREVAAQRANAAADSIRAGEAKDLEEIVGGPADGVPDRQVGGTTGGDHPQNIVDPGLNVDDSPEKTKATNKAPK